MLLINSFESKILYNSPMAIEHLGARGDDPWKHTFTRLVSSPQTSQRGFPSRFEITVTFFPKPLILVIIFTPKKQNKIPKYSMKHPFDHPSGGHLTPKKGYLKHSKKVTGKNLGIHFWLHIHPSLPEASGIGTWQNGSYAFIGSKVRGHILIEWSIHVQLGSFR